MSYPIPSNSSLRSTLPLYKVELKVSVPYFWQELMWNQSIAAARTSTYASCKFSRQDAARRVQLSGCQVCSMQACMQFGSSPWCGQQRQSHSLRDRLQLLLAELCQQPGQLQPGVDSILYAHVAEAHLLHAKIEITKSFETDLGFSQKVRTNQLLPS